MTMNFIVVRDALVSTLAAGATGKYRVLGYQKPAEAGESLTNTNRLVQVFFSDGILPKNKSAIDYFHHDLIFKIELTATMPATGDLAIIENPASTPTQLATALAGIKNAESLVDLSIDELYNDVCDVLYNNEKIDLGLSEELQDRWLSEFHKNKIAYHGDLLFLTGTIQYTCSVVEVFGGETSVSCELIDVDIQAGINEDELDPAKAGVLVEV